MAVSIENPAEVKFYKIQRYKNSIKFSPDGTGLDYSLQNRLVRHNFQTGEIKELISYPQEQVFNFAWSKDGSKLAISRGKVSQDAVLLMGF